MFKQALKWKKAIKVDGSNLKVKTKFTETCKSLCLYDNRIIKDKLESTTDTVAQNVISNK